MKLNVTALMTLDAGRAVAGDWLAGGAPAFISVFAGRIADTGRDPVPIMASRARASSRPTPHVELIWASPREMLNVVQADAIGCHVITVTHDPADALQPGTRSRRLLARHRPDVPPRRAGGGLHDRHPRLDPPLADESYAANVLRHRGGEAQRTGVVAVPLATRPDAHPDRPPAAIE